MVLLVALLAGVSDKLGHTRYSDATGVAGELTAGHSLGQTFTARHDGLSGVELQLATYAHTLSGTVVLHLRRSVGDATDLATVRLPADEVADNVWHRFSFPPIPGSGVQGYYVELEDIGGAPGNAVTAYWAMGHGDPYPYGQATQDRRPLPGDLAFGLDYDAPPWALLADAVSGMAAQLPAWGPSALSLAGLAACLLLGLILWGAAHGWFGGTRRRRTLLGALLGGFALAHGAVWALVVPPWQGPDEFSHYAYSALLAAGFDPSDNGPAAQQERARIEHSILAAMDARDFTRSVSWYGAPGGSAAGFITPASNGGASTMFVETRQPPLYYWPAALALRAGGGPDRVPPDLGLYLARAVSVLLGAVVVVAAWGCALLLAPGAGETPAIRLALPLAVALLPMRAFVDGMANNDVLAELLVSALALFCLQLTRARPLCRAWLATSGAGLLLAAAGFAVKATAALASPVLWAGAALAALAVRRSPLATRHPPFAPRQVLWLGVGLVSVGLALLAAWAWDDGFDRRGMQVAWYTEYGQRAPRIAATDAHSGSYVTGLAAGREVFQRLNLPGGHPAYTLTFRIWARAAPGARPGNLTVTVDDGTRALSPVTGMVPMLSAWQEISATATVPADLAFIRCIVRADAPAQLSDAALEPAASGPAPPAPRLYNAAMQEPGAQLRRDSALGRLLTRLPSQMESAEIADTLANRQPFDVGSVVRLYLDSGYRSYWGWFGWLVTELQLPELYYQVIGLLVAAAVAGWGVALARRQVPGGLRAFALITAVTAAWMVAAIVARYLRQRAWWGYLDLPQGRYLFVLIVPMVWLGLAGLRGWVGLLPAGARRWAAWTGLAGLVYLDLYALLVLIVPYFYGRF